MTTFTFEVENEEGESTAYTLPAHFEVCPRCEGHGTHLNPSIGEHAYSAEEFFEEFSEPEDREEYFRHGGIYDVTCEECGGKRVVPVIDEKACTTATQKEALALYLEKEASDAEYDRLCESERRMGC